MSSLTASFGCRINVTLLHACRSCRPTPWVCTRACVLMPEWVVLALLPGRVEKEGTGTVKKSSADRPAFTKLASSQSLVRESLWPHYHFIGKRLFVKFKIKEHDNHYTNFIELLLLLKTKLAISAAFTISGPLTLGECERSVVQSQMEVYVWAHKHKYKHTSPWKYFNASYILTSLMLLCI